MDRRSRGVRSDRGLCRHRHEEIEKALKGGDTPSMPIEDPVETGKLLERGGVGRTGRGSEWEGLQLAGGASFAVDVLLPCGCG